MTPTECALSLSGDTNKMKKGDIVRFIVCIDEDDNNLRFLVLENPDGGRVLVEAIVDMNLRPTYRYNVADLEVCTA